MAARIYSDSEWQSFIQTDAEGYALEADSVLATRHQTTRQTIHAVRKRLGIKSLRRYRQDHQPRRDVRIGVDLTKAELSAIDQYADFLGLSRSSYLGAVGSMPAAAALVEQTLQRHVPSSSTTSGADAAVRETPNDVEVGEAT